MVKRKRMGRKREESTRATIHVVRRRVRNEANSTEEGKSKGEERNWKKKEREELIMFSHQHSHREKEKSVDSDDPEREEKRDEGEDNEQINNKKNKKKEENGNSLSPRARSLSGLRQGKEIPTWMNESMCASV